MRWQQSEDYLIMMHEFQRMTRIIPLDGRDHRDYIEPSFYGDPVGHWEGDTLVVETTNFLRETSFRGGVTTADLHLIERFTRVSDGTMMYRVTVEDPNAWDQPWTYQIPMVENPMPLCE